MVRNYFSEAGSLRLCMAANNLNFQSDGNHYDIANEDKGNFIACEVFRQYGSKPCLQMNTIFDEEGFSSKNSGLSIKRYTISSGKPGHIRL